MSGSFQVQAFLDNPVVWAILVLGLFCYILEFDLLFAPRDDNWRRKLRTWLKVLPVLLSALPLLGLLGTIAGLLATFHSMAIAGGLDQQQLLSSGIADALITTQLGLVLTIPGLLLFSLIRARYREQSA